MTPDQIAALWRLEVGLREKMLWRLLYETAGCATEILTLDVADLDPANKCARVISKGGDTDRVYHQTGTTLLLPRLLADRPHPRRTRPGPVPGHRPRGCPTAAPPNSSPRPLRRSPAPLTAHAGGP